MKPKEARCKYNAARSQYTTFKPNCVFVEKVFGSMFLPPHIDFFRREMKPTTCRVCKCFEEEGVNQYANIFDEVIELRQLLRDLCVPVPADEEQLKRIAELVKGVEIDED